MGRGIKVAEQSRESDELKKPSLEQVCRDVGNGKRSIEELHGWSSDRNGVIILYSILL